MDLEKVQKLQEIVDGSSNIVFFGGAGVSTFGVRTDCIT